MHCAPTAPHHGAGWAARAAKVDKVRERLVGMDAAVLPYLQPGTARLKIDVEIPRAIKTAYFKHMKQGLEPDALSNGRLRMTWRKRMSYEKALAMGYAEGKARSVYYDGIVDSRQVTGVSDLQSLKETVDAEVDKVLRAERAAGRDPWSYLSKYAKEKEYAGLVQKRDFMEQQAEDARLEAKSGRLKAHWDDVSTESDEEPVEAPPPPPAHAPATAPEVRGWKKAMAEAEELWLLEDPGFPKLGALPLLPSVDRPRRASVVTPEPQIAAQVHDGVVSVMRKRLGPRQRAKARGEAVKPNMGSNARRKAKLRLERSLAEVQRISGALRARDNEPMAMMAPVMASVEVEGVAAVEMEAVVAELSVARSDTALTQRLPPPPCDHVVDLNAWAAVGRIPTPLPSASHASGSVRSYSEMEPLTPFMRALRGAPGIVGSDDAPVSVCVQTDPTGFAKVEAQALSLWRSLMALLSYFVVGLTFVGASVRYARIWTCLYGSVARCASSRAAETVVRWAVGWPGRPHTPPEYVGDPVFTKATQIAGNGHRPDDGVELYAKSMHATAVNAQARNADKDGTDTYVTGVDAHRHADTLSDYSRACAYRATRRSRFMRVLRRILWVSFIFATVFPTVWYVYGDEGRPEGSDRQSVGSAACEYFTHVVLPIGLAAHAFDTYVKKGKKTAVGHHDFALNHGGLLIPGEMRIENLPQGAYRLNATTTETTCLGFGQVSKLGAHCKIQCDLSIGCLSPVSRGGTLVGWTTGTGHVLRKCLCNAHNALCHRHGSVQPPVTRDVNEVFEDFRDAILEGSPKYWLQPMIDFAVWLMKWPAGKQNSIEQSIRTEAPMPKKVKAMVKREVAHKEPSKARMIQFYWNLATQALFGPQFYAAQKTLCEIFRRKRMRDGIDVTFASGMRADEIGEWMEGVLAEGARTFYERDGKNWDSSMQVSHARFRQNLYRVYDVELGDFASSCDKVRGFAVFPGGTLRYSMDYTVKSGHNDTTLGNSLVNAAIAYAAFKRMKIPASILVAGDDLLVACYGDVDAQAAIAMEREYGITPEARVFDDYTHTTFISGFWIGDGSKIGFVPLPGRLFARLWWTVSPPSAKKLEPYRRGVSRGLIPVAGDIPLVRVLLSAFDSQGKAIASDKGRAFRGSSFSFTEGIWRAMERRYGLTTEDMLACEGWLEGLPKEPLVLKHPVLDRIMEVDLADISDRGAGVW